MGEQARVKEERVALDKVKNILEKLLANGGKAKVEIEASGRKLLSTSRTVTLLTAPSFIASLQNADPAKVQSVLDIVINLIKEGEEDQKKAEDAYAEVLRKAAEAASAHEDEMYRIRDDMKVLLETQIDFTNREIARIDAEKAILLEAINLQSQLHRVTQLLA